VFSRDPLQNPDLLKPKTYNVAATIKAQLATAFLSILIGAGSLYFLAKVFDELSHSFAVNTKAEIGFGLLSFMPFVFFLVSLLWAVDWQFTEASSSARVAQSWKYHALWIGLFPGLILLCFLSMMGLYEALLSIIYHLIQTVLLSFILVTVQRTTLKFWAFDEIKHHWLVSAEANLWACKAGVLPYREKVTTIWMMIGFGVFAIFLSVLTWVILNADETPDTGASIFACLFLPALILFCLWGSVIAWETLGVKNFSTVEGKISKSMTPRRYRSPPTYTVHCNEQSFSTEHYLWHHMYVGSRYRLWYIPSGRNLKMIAFERIPDPQPVPKPAPILPEKKGCLPALFQSGRRGRNAKHSKSPELH
jgi:hypothetical protein